jgi:hypothetical protein
LRGGRVAVPHNPALSLALDEFVRGDRFFLAIGKSGIEFDCRTACMSRPARMLCRRRCSGVAYAFEKERTGEGRKLL